MKISIYITLIELILMPFLLLFFQGIGLIVLLFLISPILGNIFFLYKLKKLFKVKIEYVKIARVLIANLITVLLIVPLILIAPNHFIVLPVIGAFLILFVYPVFLAKVKALTNEDIKRIKYISAKIPILRQILDFYMKFSGFFIVR